MSPSTNSMAVATSAEALAGCRVREEVERDDGVVGMRADPVAHEVRADEAGGAGDEKVHAASLRAAPSATGAQAHSAAFGSRVVVVTSGTLPAVVAGAGLVSAVAPVRPVRPVRPSWWSSAR